MIIPLRNLPITCGTYKRLLLTSTTTTQANLNQQIVSAELDPEEGSTVIVLLWIGVSITRKELCDSGNIFTTQLSNLFKGP